MKDNCSELKAESKKAGKTTCKRAYWKKKIKKVNSRKALKDL